MHKNETLKKEIRDQVTFGVQSLESQGDFFFAFEYTLSFYLFSVFLDKLWFHWRPLRSKMFSQGICATPSSLLQRSLHIIELRTWEMIFILWSVISKILWPRITKGCLWDDKVGVLFSFFFSSIFSPSLVLAQ